MDNVKFLMRDFKGYLAGTVLKEVSPDTVPGYAMARAITRSMRPEKTFSVVGTPEYLVVPAFEQLLGDVHPSHPMFTAPLTISLVALSFDKLRAGKLCQISVSTHNWPCCDLNVVVNSDELYSDYVYLTDRLQEELNTWLTTRKANGVIDLDVEWALKQINPGMLNSTYELAVGLKAQKS